MNRQWAKQVIDIVLFFDVKIWRNYSKMLRLYTVRWWVPPVSLVIIFSMYSSVCFEYFLILTGQQGLVIGWRWGIKGQGGARVNCEVSSMGGWVEAGVKNHIREGGDWAFDAQQLLGGNVLEAVENGSLKFRRELGRAGKSEIMSMWLVSLCKRPLGDYVFQGSCPCHLNCEVDWHKVVHSISL